MERITVILVCILVPLQGLFCLPGSVSGPTLILNPYGARSWGLARAYTAVCDDVNTITANPSGLAELKTPEVSFMNLKWLQQVSLNYLAGVYPLPRAYGIIGVGGSAFIYDDHKYYDDDGNYLRTLSYNELAFNIAYARSVIQNLNSGINVKYISSTIGEKYASSYALDLGFLYKVSDMNIGVSIQNIGKGLKYNKEYSDLPLNINMGVRYILFDILLLSADINKPFHDDIILGAGSEIRLFNIISLRMGYRIWSHDLYPIVAGMGLSYAFNRKLYKLDYALVPVKHFGYKHAISFSIKFNLKISGSS